MMYMYSNSFHFLSGVDFPLEQLPLCMCKGQHLKFNVTQKRKSVAKGGGGVKDLDLTFCKVWMTLICFLLILNLNKFQLIPTFF